MFIERAFFCDKSVPRENPARDIKTRILCLGVHLAQKKIGSLSYLNLAFQLYSFQWYKLITFKRGVISTPQAI